MTDEDEEADEDDVVESLNDDNDDDDDAIENIAGEDDTDGDDSDEETGDAPVRRTRQQRPRRGPAITKSKKSSNAARSFSFRSSKKNAATRAPH